MIRTFNCLVDSSGYDSSAGHGLSVEATQQHSSGTETRNEFQGYQSSVNNWPIIRGGVPMDTSRRRGLAPFAMGRKRCGMGRGPHGISLPHYTYMQLLQQYYTQGSSIIVKANSLLHHRLSYYYFTKRQLLRADPITMSTTRYLGLLQALTGRSPMHDGGLFTTN